MCIIPIQVFKYNLIIVYKQQQMSIIAGHFVKENFTLRIGAKYRKRLDNEVVFCIIGTVARRASHSIEMMGWIRHRLKCLRLIQLFCFSCGESRKLALMSNRIRSGRDIRKKEDLIWTFSPERSNQCMSNICPPLLAVP